MLRNIVSFDTFDEMINSNDVKPGMVILTLGKSGIGDGNGSVYRVINGNETIKNKNYEPAICQSIANKSIKFIKIDIDRGRINNDIDTKVEESKQSTINLLLSLPR